MKASTNTLTFASLVLSCARAENLRAGGRDLAELWEKMESINNDLRNKISGLEREVNELQQHRLLSEACAILLSDDGICQLTQPLEILDNLAVAGNSTFGENVDVAGKTGLKTTSIDGDLVVIGSTELEALNINSTLDVNGDVYFAANLDVADGLNVTGVIHTTDLTVLNTVTVSGDSKFEGNVTIEAPMVPEGFFMDAIDMPIPTLTVGGNLTIAGDTMIAGRTTLQDDVTIAYPPAPPVPVDSTGPGGKKEKEKEDKKEKEVRQKNADTVTVEVLKYPSLFVAGGISAIETVTFAKNLNVAYSKMLGLSVTSGCDGCADDLTLSLAQYTESPTSAPVEADKKKDKKGAF
jgi:cytoskeletal protein CcmA (bactofilin family)